MLSFMNRIHFRTRLLISYIAVALIPFSLYSIASGAVFLHQAQETAFSHMEQITSQVGNAMDVYIGTIEKLADGVSALLLDEMQSGTLSEEGRKRIQSNLDYTTDSHPELAGVLVAFRDDSYLSIGLNRISRDSFAAENWYVQACSQRGQMVLVSSAAGRNVEADDRYSVDDVFSLSKAVQDPVTGEIQAVILFDVRHTIIKDSINRVSIGENGFVFVLDDEENVVYAPVNKVIYRINPAWLQEGRSNLLTVRIDGAEYDIYGYSSEYTGWKTVGVFPVKELMEGAQPLVVTLAVSLLVALGLMLSASLFISNAITSPISKLRRLMKQAESGDLTVRFHPKYNDEISDLGNSFNSMIGRMDGLIHQVCEEQKHKRDAELKSLQEQIKPHFLYNTLDTINWMAREYDAENIVQLVEALTSMFRIGLSQGKDRITLREECSHVSNYLYIQKIRYQDKLNYTLRIPETLMGLYVPKLILQPLVENAIYHGLKQKPGGGTISVSAEQEEEAILRLIVEDDGAGIAPERLAYLKRQLDGAEGDTEKQSFGLFYVAERIRLSYGSGYGVTIDGEQGKGTRVTVTLPVKERGTEYVQGIDCGR